jgi:uncharacterized protein
VDTMTSQSARPAREAGRWLVLLELTMAVIVIQAGLVVSSWLGEGLRAGLGLPPGPAGTFDLLFALLSIGGTLGAYLFYVCLVERRPPTELGLAGAGWELIGGVLIGGGLMVLCVGVLWSLGAYQIVGVNPPVVLMSAVAAALFRGFVEELLVRGVGLRLGARLLGTWPALLLSAAFFGLVHARNPGASVTSTLGVAVGGLLLGAAFLATGRLWLAAGLHGAWNFTQGGVFGLEVSGVPSVGLLQSELAGPDLLTGATFGVEASLLAILACLTATAGLLAWAQCRRAVSLQEQ